MGGTKEDFVNFTRDHHRSVDERARETLLASDHFRANPRQGVYSYLLSGILLPGDVVPVRINKCAIQFMKGHVDGSCGNSARRGFDFFGNPSTTTMVELDPGYRSGIRYGSCIHNCVDTNGRLGSCNISPTQTKSCRCDNISDYEAQISVKQLTWFENVIREKGACGFYHSLAGEAAGVVSKIINNLDVPSYQKCDATFHLQFISYAKTPSISDDKQLKRCSDTIKSVSDGYANCCEKHTRLSGMSRPNNPHGSIHYVACRSNRLVYVSDDVETWKQSDVWKNKASNRSRGMFEGDRGEEIRRNMRKSWDDPDKKKPTKTRREATKESWNEPDKNEPSKTRREVASEVAKVSIDLPSKKKPSKTRR
jgi:hypothetical protein